MTIQLKGMTWNHTRGYTPMVACAQRFEELNPNVTISWDKRSLQAFADEPIDQLAERYDLLVIDHPWTGFAANEQVILPLEDYLPADFLADQAANSVGESHNSYRFFDKQWALAIDAATPVASGRPDLLINGELPQTWDQLMALAEQGKVAVPSIPQDTLMNFYMLCSTLGEDVCQQEDIVVSRAVGREALNLLKALSDKLPRACFDWNPIKVYEAMTRTNDLAYCPFAYGYANYSEDGYAAHRLCFGDTVALGNGKRLRTTLGGTGLAISSRCVHKDIAAQFAQFVAAPAMQQGFYVQYGGQPGHRAAWTSAEAHARSHNYFENTLATLDRAFLRPRYHGHMAFQDNAGAPIRQYLLDGGNVDALLDKLDNLYLKSRKG